MHAMMPLQVMCTIMTGAIWGCTAPLAQLQMEIGMHRIQPDALQAPGPGQGSLIITVTSAT